MKISRNISTVKDQILSFKPEIKKVKQLSLVYQYLRSINHYDKKNVKNGCVHFKRNNINSHFATLEGTRNMPSFTPPLLPVTWAAAEAHRLVAEVGIAAAEAMSAAVETAAPTPSCLTRHHSGFAPGAAATQAKTPPPENNQEGQVP